MTRLLASGAFVSTTGEPFTEAFVWITGTLLGSVALALCVLAVAFVGFSMLTGRLPIKLGLRVVLGCFILLAAPVIASAFLQSPLRSIAAPPAEPSTIAKDDPRKDLPPSDYDPYAGASLRRD